MFHLSTFLCHLIVNMDDSLFRKYKTTLEKNKSDKKIIIDTVFEATNILLSEEEIVLSKKQVSFSISSAKRAKFHQARIESLLQDLGYKVSY